MLYLGRLAAIMVGGVAVGNLEYSLEVDQLRLYSQFVFFCSNE